MKKILFTFAIIFLFHNLLYTQTDKIQKTGVLISTSQEGDIYISSSRDVQDSLDLFPGVTYQRYWYFWSNGGPITANLQVTPQVSWLTVTPSVFTSTGCDNPIPVIFYFTAPIITGTYVTTVHDLNNNWQDVNVTLRVTNTPTINRSDSTIQLSSGQTIYKYEYVPWKGRNTSSWYQIGYCGSNPYIPGNQMTVSYSEVPSVNWFTINPTNFTVNLADSVLVTKTFTAPSPGIYSVFECKYAQWYKERYIYWTIIVSTDIKKINEIIPESYKLSQNYPNPFNPKTNIKFDLPKASNIKLIVYDALGREVTTLVNEELKAGSYQVDWDGSGYPSGVYFYRLEVGNFVETKKMLLIK